MGTTRRDRYLNRVQPNEVERQLLQWELDLQGARERLEAAKQAESLTVDDKVYVLVRRQDIVTVLAHLDALDGVDAEEPGNGYVDQG